MDLCKYLDGNNISWKSGCLVLIYGQICVNRCHRQSNKSHGGCKGLKIVKPIGFIGPVAAVTGLCRRCTRRRLFLREKGKMEVAGHANK